MCEADNLTSESQSGRVAVRGQGDAGDADAARRAAERLVAPLRNDSDGKPNVVWHPSPDMSIIYGSLAKRARDAEVNHVAAIIAAELAAPAPQPHADAGAARLAELEAIVAKLPRTADGVPITAGMTLWSIGRVGDTEVFEMEATCETEAKHKHGRWRGGRESIEGCYSTREAAIAAKGPPMADIAAESARVITQMAECTTVQPRDVTEEKRAAIEALHKHAKLVVAWELNGVIGYVVNRGIIYWTSVMSDGFGGSPWSSGLHAECSWGENYSDAEKFALESCRELGAASARVAEAMRR